MANKEPKEVIDALIKEVDVFQAGLNKLEEGFKKAEDPEMFTGKVFVSFEYIKDKEACNDKFKRGCFKGFLLNSGLFKCCAENYKQYCFVKDN